MTLSYRIEIFIQDKSLNKIGVEPDSPPLGEDAIINVISIV